LKRNPTSTWVDFKTTHQSNGCTQKSTHARPLNWGNKKMQLILNNKYVCKLMPKTSFIYVKHGTCNLENMNWEEFLSMNRDKYPYSFENLLHALVAICCEGNDC
jgi:hypothetical protein